MVLYTVCVSSYSVAMAAVYWLPCCSLEGEVELVVAMVVEDQRGEEAVGCWGEGVEAASYPLEEAANLQGNKKSKVFFESSCNYYHFKLFSSFGQLFKI